jgi:hypothetical protein
LYGIDVWRITMAACLKYCVYLKDLAADSSTTEDKSQLICTLTGIFGRTHNSSTRIPLNGLLPTQEREQWLRAAENLLNLWAGVYDVNTQPIGLLPPGSQPAVTYALPVLAPKVMQR